MMGWIYLLSAILLEVSGTMSMKLSEGLTKTIPSILIFIFYGLSLSLLTLALKSIPVSVAYAIWSGIGTALIAVIGFTINSNFQLLSFWIILSTLQPSNFIGLPVPPSLNIIISAITLKAISAGVLA